MAAAVIEAELRGAFTGRGSATRPAREILAWFMLVPASAFHVVSWPKPTRYDSVGAAAAGARAVTSDGPGRLVRMGNVGRNEPCPCGSGRKAKRCCGIDRGPGEESVARAFLSQISRDAAVALDGVSEPAVEALLEDLRDLPAAHPSMRVELPDGVAPALERLTDTYAVGDANGAWGPLDAIMEEVDTPIERARLVRVVLSLREEGQLSERAAAAAALELATRGSRELLRECMTEAVAAWVSDAYVRRGVLAGSGASAHEAEPGRLNLVDR
jgi:SEC-C motif